MGIRDFMISRVAEHCFWMFRYLERGEILTRMLSTVYVAELDGRDAAVQNVSHLLTLSQERPLFNKIYSDKENDLELVEHFLTWQKENGNSLHTLFTSARTNAQLTREIINESMWRTINAIYLRLNDLEGKNLTLEGRYGLYVQILESLQRIKGNFFGLLLRDDYYHMMNLGQTLECATQVFNMLSQLSQIIPTRPLDHHSLDHIDTLVLLLECFGSKENFLKREHAFTISSFVRFFLFDKCAPFSLLSSLEGACRSYNALSVPRQQGLADPGRLMEELIDDLSEMSLAALLEDSPKNMQKYNGRFIEINNAIHRVCFANNGLSPISPETNLKLHHAKQ